MSKRLLYFFLNTSLSCGALAFSLDRGGFERLAVYFLYGLSAVLLMLFATGFIEIVASSQNLD